jgi:hypothetical protein
MSMAKLTVKEVLELARKILSESLDGIRFNELRRRILEIHPETNSNMIGAQIGLLHLKFPGEIIRPSRGLYKLAAGPRSEPPPNGVVSSAVHEEDFYQPLADWLKDDLGEVTEAASLGGAAMGKKWGTPDVVGVYKPEASDLIKFQAEIVSAEVKIDPQQPVVAFGQAIAYRLFSAKTYIAMPNSMGEEDKDRLESLCMLFGVGLALFDLDPKNPDFTIRVRAQRFSPDMFYVNQFAERLNAANHELFRRLF